MGKAGHFNYYWTKVLLFCNIKIFLDQLIKHANIWWNHIWRCNNCLKLNWHSWVDRDISACSSISTITATVPVATHKYNCKRFQTIILVFTGACTSFYRALWETSNCCVQKIKNDKKEDWYFELVDRILLENWYIYQSKRTGYRPLRIGEKKFSVTFPLIENYKTLKKENNERRGKYWNQKLYKKQI